MKVKIPHSQYDFMIIQAMKKIMNLMLKMIMVARDNMMIVAMMKNVMLMMTNDDDGDDL